MFFVNLGFVLAFAHLAIAAAIDSEVVSNGNKIQSQDTNKTYLPFPKIRVVAQHLILYDDGDEDGGRKDETSGTELPKELIQKDGSRQETLMEVISEEANSNVVLNEKAYQDSVIHLECVAPYPTQWIYEGEGFPDPSLTFVETKRQFVDYANASTYSFSTKLDIISINEKGSGRYACRHLKDPAVESYFNIFSPGKNVFVAPNEIGIVRGKILKLEDSLSEDQPLNRSFTILLPCSVSNPNETVTLSRIQRIGEAIYIQQQPIDGVRLRFDPAQGFLLKTSESSKPWGSYLCMDSRNARLLKVIVEAPKAWLVRVTPNEKYVSQNQSQVVIRCEAKEPIRLVFGEENDEVPKVKYTNLPANESQFPFIAEIAIGESFKSQVANLGHLNGDFIPIKCMASQYKKTFHIWDYSNYGIDKAVFTYNSSTTSFSCCTNSYHSPLLNFIPCSTPIECHLRKHMAGKTLGSSFVGGSANDNSLAGILLRNESHCISLGFRSFRKALTDSDGEVLARYYQTPESVPKSNPKNGGSGMAQCLVGDRMEEFYFAWRMDSSNNSDQPILSFDEIESNSEIMDIQIKSNTDAANESLILEGLEVEVECRYNKFFFSKGHVWFFEWENGTQSIVPKELLSEKVQLSEPYLSNFYDESDQEALQVVTTIRFPEPQILRLVCSAPLWYSGDEWRNVSIPVVVTPAPTPIIEVVTARTLVL